LARVVGEREPHLADDRIGDLVEAERRTLAQCRVECRAQDGDVHEIVEVPGLERSVLPAIGEGQELVAAAQCAGVA